LLLRRMVSLERLRGEPIEGRNGHATCGSFRPAGKRKWLVLLILLTAVELRLRSKSLVLSSIA
jgi:hypothetical protein